MSDQWSNEADRIPNVPAGGATDPLQTDSPTINAGETDNLSWEEMNPTQSSMGGTSGGTSGGGSMAQQAKEAGKSAMGAMEDVQRKASEFGDQATERADMTKDKAAGGLDSLASTLRDKSETIGDGQIGQVATMAADRLEQGAQMLRSKDTDQMVSELEALIRRRPLESLLVAAGAGYLLSKSL